MNRLVKVKSPLPSTVLLFFALLMVIAYPNVNNIRAILFMALGVYLLIMKIVTHKPVRWVHLLWLVGFYVLSIISKRWSIYPSGAATVISNIAYAVLLNWCMGEYVCQGKRSMTHMCSIMAVMAVLLALNFMVNSTIEEGRYSLEINANTMGVNAAYLFGVLLYGAKESNWKKIHFNVLTLVVALIALLTGSRKALLMLAVFALAYLFFWKPEKNMGKFVVRMVIVLAVGVVVLILLMKVDVLYNAIGNRLESLYLQWFEGEESDASAISRARMISIGMNMFSESPIYGLGHNAFKLTSGYWTYSHNNYVELMCSLGILGLLVFYAPLIYFTVETFRLWRRGVPGAVFPLTVFLIQYINDFGHVSYYSFHIHIFLGMAVGYVYLLKQEYRQGKYDDIISL